MVSRDRINPLIISHLTEQIDRKQSLRVRINRRVDQIDVNVVCVGLNIHEDRLSSNQSDHFSRADPCKRNSDNFVTWSYAQDSQCNFKSARATGDRYAVLHSHIASQSAFQFPYLRTHDELTMLQHAANTLVHVSPIAAVLFFEVDELH